MASRRVVCGGGAATFGGSNAKTSIQRERVSCSSESFDSVFASGSSPSFLGSRSIFSFETGGKIPLLSFEDNNGGKRVGRSSFHLFDPEEYIDDELDEYLHQPEKKKRLTSSQIQFLEANFELENKLEPERKIQLAKDIGLQPRQVAIWFQNRKARLKTNHLEQDYKALKARYDNLRADYDSILMEKEKLKAEVHQITENLIFAQKKGNLESQPPPEKSIVDSISDDKVSKVTIVACSNVPDSDTPRYTHGFSSSRFEPDQSDLSQDEEDNFSRSLDYSPLAYLFPNIEGTDCCELPANSYYFGFPTEDDNFGLWS